jgi:hypothetical protein
MCMASKACRRLQPPRLGEFHQLCCPSLHTTLTTPSITGFAGWQAEYHVYLCGLDIEEKCKWTEDQVRHELGEEMLKKFTVLKFMQNGSSVIDARNQDVATVDFRIFAQSKDRELLSMRNPNGFFRRSMTTFLQSAPVRPLHPPRYHLFGER